MHTSLLYESFHLSSKREVPNLQVHSVTRRDQRLMRKLKPSSGHVEDRWEGKDYMSIGLAKGIVNDSRHWPMRDYAANH